MPGYSPNALGDRVLEKSFRVGPSGGLLPWRCVILDNVATPQYGNAWLPPVKNPATTFANGERVLGVITDPASLATTGSDGLAPASAWAAFNSIAQNKSVNVRVQGIVPILCDDSTDGTNINAGDYVRSSTSTTTTISSQTVTMAGTIAKAALTNNAITANQHVVGLSFTRVAPSADSSLYALVKLQPGDF